MKTSSKIVFSMLTVLLVLAMLFGAGPVDSVKAEAAQSPLAASNIWAGSMGGTSDEYSSSIVIDAGGNLYITGGFSGIADFDPGVDIFNLTATGDRDVFISKLDASGNFAWAMGLGGQDAYVTVSDSVVDSNGNVYASGYFYGTVDFDPGAGTYNLTSATDYGYIFISKLDSNGNFVWAKGIGGTQSFIIDCYDIALDANGNIYITGDFAGTVDFDPGAGIYNLTNVGIYPGLLPASPNVFISKLDTNGNFAWAKGIGGGDLNFAEGHSIALDFNGNVYTTGRFGGTADFDPDTGTYNLISTEGGPDIFVSKLSSNGNFVWAKSMGGMGLSEVGNDIILDSSGNVYTTGAFEATADFDPGAGTFYLTSAGEIDIFVSKFDNNGDFVWAMGMGGVGYDDSSSIALDSSGNIYTTGYFTFTADFDPYTGYANLPSVGGADIFISKLNNYGAFVFAKSMGGLGDDYSKGIALGASDNIYTTGNFIGTADFDPNPGTISLTTAGESDIFISKLDNEPGILPTFGDVHFNHPMYKYIQALYDGGFSAGCSTDPLLFCPDTILDRAQSAVFMLRGQLGTNYTPPDAPWNTFIIDDWTGFEYAQSWAEGMYQEGLTQGCQSSPLMYCPATQLPRVEASVFGLRMKYGVNYTPPAATGTLFADFPSTDPSYWGIDWAEQAYNDGLLPACGTDSATGKPMFCPSELVDRGWGAYLIVKAKNLQLP